MSRDVKQVSEIAREVGAVGQRAREVADRLKRSVAATHEALDVADDVGKTLDQAAAELRGALGMNTNNPPTDAEEETK